MSSMMPAAYAALEADEQVVFCDLGMSQFSITSKNPQLGNHGPNLRIANNSCVCISLMAFMYVANTAVPDTAEELQKYGQEIIIIGFALWRSYLNEMVVRLCAPYIVNSLGEYNLAVPDSHKSAAEKQHAVLSATALVQLKCVYEGFRDTTDALPESEIIDRFVSTYSLTDFGELLGSVVLSNPLDERLRAVEWLHQSTNFFGDPYYTKLLKKINMLVPLFCEEHLASAKIVRELQNLVGHVLMYPTPADASHIDGLLRELNTNHPLLSELLQMSVERLHRVAVCCIGLNVDFLLGLLRDALEIPQNERLDTHDAVDEHFGRLINAKTQTKKTRLAIAVLYCMSACGTVHHGCARQSRADAGHIGKVIDRMTPPWRQRGILKMRDPDYFANNAQRLALMMPTCHEISLDTTPTVLVEPFNTEDLLKVMTHEARRARLPCGAIIILAGADISFCVVARATQTETTYYMYDSHEVTEARNAVLAKCTSLQTMNQLLLEHHGIASRTKIACHVIQCSGSFDEFYSDLLHNYNEIGPSPMYNKI